MRVEVSLLANLGHITQCGKVVRNCFCPAAGQLLQEPVLIQSLNVICRVFQLIFQKHIAVLESAAEGIVEVPIEAIHLIRLLRIELPDCFRFYDMEACCILLIKVLHLCNIVETVGGDARDSRDDRNVLPSKQAAEAHIALMQLHQLRDAWREGWLPDWKDDKQEKYIILQYKGEYQIRQYKNTSYFLSFQDEKRANEFLTNFRELIEQAGDLI